MKGTLHKTIKGEWVVRVVSEETPECETIVEHGKQYPIHPYQDELKMVMILNTPVSQFEGKEVEFKIVKEYTNKHSNEIQSYAELINKDNTNTPKTASKEFDDFLESVKAIPDYPELEGTLAMTNDVIWNRIYDEYSKEQYPPFGGPFTDSLSFIDWLKQNYKAPINLKTIDPHVSDDFQIGPDGAYEHKESQKITWGELFNDVESKLDIYIPIRAINYIKNTYKKPKRKK